MSIFEKFFTTTVAELFTPTVAELLDDYYKDFTFRGCRSTKSLRSEIANLKTMFEGVKANQVTKAMLLDYQQKQRMAGWAAATVNKSLAILRAAFNVAAYNEKIAAVPTWPKRLRTAKPRQGFFERADYLAMRDALPYQWAKDILDLGYYSGWRRNEILGLTWKEVDVHGWQIRLDPDRSKNYRGRAPLHLADFALEMMERRFAGKDENDEHVFVKRGRRGQLEIGPTHWHEVWKKAATEIGRPELIFHDLRRTVVRNLELSGVPRSVAMAWVGHRTEAIYRRYSIVVEKDLIPAAGKFVSMITGQEQESGKPPETSDEEKATKVVAARFREPELEDEKLYE